MSLSKKVSGILGRKQERKSPISRSAKEFVKVSVGPKPEAGPKNGLMNVSRQLAKRQLAMADEKEIIIR